MNNKLLVIDDAIRSDHCWLDAADNCFYFGEYTAYRGFDHSATNGLISNLKKSLDRRGKPEWAYKERAIVRSAVMLAPILAACTSPVVLIPVPPSKARDDQLYDDRMSQVLRRASANLPHRVSELIVQRQSTVAVHSSSVRLSIQELIDNYSIDKAELNRLGEVGDIIILDDVLTTGAHFKAMKAVLTAVFPAANIFGIFIARRVPEPIVFPDFEGFDIL